MARRRAVVLVLLLVPCALAGCARERPPGPRFGAGPSSGAYSWFHELQTLYPGLSEASFRPAATDRLQPAGEPRLRLWDAAASPEAIAVWKSLSEISPDGTRAVSLCFDNLAETDSGWVVGGNPDAYIAVFRTDTWMGSAVFTCGTPCRFHAAGWAGNDTVVVMGKTEDIGRFREQFRV